MSMEQMGAIESGENIDPRLEEILSYYDRNMWEDAKIDWEEYSEAERDRLYSEFMKDHKIEAA